MKLMPLATSLLALTLFTGVASASSKTLPEGSFVVAQATDDSGATAQGGKRAEAIKKFLAVKQPVAKMPEQRLQQRLQRAKALLNTKNLAADLKSGLEGEIAELEGEIAKRQAAGGATAPAEQQAGAAGNDNAASDDAGDDAASSGAANASSASVLNDNRPLSELNNKELRTRMRSALQAAKAQGTSKADRQKLREIAKATRAEIDKRRTGKAQAGTDGAAKPAAGTTEQTAEAGTTSTEGAAQPAGAAEAKARVLIDDTTDVKTMSDADLRKRLKDMRDVLADKSLSKQSQQTLRKKLADERLVLRSRVNQSGSSEQTGGSTTVTGDNNTVNNTTVNTTVINNQTINMVTKDRRPAKDLTEAELRLRIRVLRQIAIDNKYNEQDRRTWRETVDLDRRFLNQRMLDDRRRRQSDLTVGVSTGKFKFNLGLDFEPNARPRPDIFAAEADIQDIEDVLAAPPRRKIARRYSVDEISASRELRDSVARIEIDTVHFGFGEGFLREEEIENLERIAEIMERILAVSPGEVFMIEGHTDAVGSDEANKQLSRERAEAVKKALSDYFVIPAENLKPVGLGERYLKIPTEEAEAENRRVSIARVTPLVGALDR